MNKLALILSLAVAGGITANSARAIAEDDKGYDAKVQTMSGEVVSTDATAKTLTLKTDSQGDRTLTVDAKATAALKTVKAGDRVTVKLQNNAVTEIKTSTNTTPNNP